ncbi:MAG: GumC family protein, partial [Pseudomonadota bacterium]
MHPFETEQGSSIVDYYMIVERHKYAVIFFLVISILLAVLHNSKLVPIYSTTATMIIDRETKTPLPGQERFYESYVSETLSFKTHFEMITSLPVLEHVVKDLKMDQKDTREHQQEVEKIFPFRQYLRTINRNTRALMSRLIPSSSKPDFEDTAFLEDPATAIARSLKGIIKVEQIEETRLFKLTITHTDPSIAKDIANSLAQAYIDFNIETRMKASQNTLKWLTTNLDEMKSNLQKAEEEFTNFKQKEELISIEKSQEVIAQKIRDFNNSYIEARNRRLEIETKLDQLKQASLVKGENLQIRYLITSPQIDSLYSELLSTEAELSRITQIYKEKHPKIVQTENKIQNIKQTIQDEIKKELNRLNTERAVLIAKEKVIQNTITDFKKEAMETGKKELSHNILQRNVQMNQKLYDAIMASLKETDLAQNLDVSNIRIMEKAPLPTAPIGPDKKKNLIISLIIGLMLGIGYSFS